MPTASVLFLDDVPGALALQSALGVAAHFASAPLEAAKLLAAARPAAMALGTARAWSRELVESLSPGERPAVIAVGERTAATLGLADQWLRPGWGPAEARTVFARALARARSRLRGSEGPTQPLRRAAFLRAFVRKCDPASRRGVRSVILFRLDGASSAAPSESRRERQWLPEAGSILRSRTRRSELCGRLGDRLFAVALSGGLASATRTAARLSALLAARGIAASSRCLEVDPKRPLRALRERAAA
ncbi:MAG: hypothetical protein ACYDCL_16250 [Myxococcales bacterium]